MASITVLREDGSGEPYVHPGSRVGHREPYFQISHEYWLQGYVETLNLPGKAVLLILLSLRDWAAVPSGKAPRWYGISPDTFERGLGELKEQELLISRKRRIESPLSPTFYAIQHHYRLLPPFRAATTRAEWQAIIAEEVPLEEAI